MLQTRLASLDVLVLNIPASPPSDRKRTTKLRTFISPSHLSSSDYAHSNNNVIARETTICNDLSVFHRYLRLRYGSTLGPTGGSDIDATRISAFYIINKVLDYAHKYGWIELSYNFRFINLGKGGAAHGRRPRIDECRIRAGRSTRISLRYPGLFAL